MDEPLQLLEAKAFWTEEWGLVLTCIGTETRKKFSLCFSNFHATVVCTGNRVEYLGEDHPDHPDLLPWLPVLRGAYKARCEAEAEAPEANSWHYALDVAFHLRHVHRSVHGGRDGRAYWTKKAPAPVRVAAGQKPALYGHDSGVYGISAQFADPSAIYQTRDLIRDAADFAEMGEDTPGGPEFLPLWQTVAGLRLCEEKYTHEARWLEEQGLTYGSVFSVKSRAIGMDSRRDSFARSTRADVELHLESAYDFVVEDSIVFKDVPLAEKMRVASFDIETVNTQRGDVVPLWDQPHAHIYAIALFTHTGDEEVCTVFYARAAAFRGTHPGLDKEVAARVGDTRFVLCEDESMLLQKFILAVRRFHPDVLATYNGNGYDWPFVLHRCGKLGVDASLGIFTNSHAFPRKKTYDSAAAGQRDSWEVVSFPHSHPFTRQGELRRGGHSGIPGVLLLDMYKIVQDSHKLSSYKLDFVARELLGSDGAEGAGKVQLSYAEQRRLHLTERVESGPPPAKRTKPAEPVGPAHALAKIVEYVAQDAHLVQRLMDTTLTLSKTVALAALTSTPMQAVVDRGQQIKVYNTLVRTAHDQNRIVNNTLPCERQLTEVPGATVLPPTTGFHAPCKASALEELQELPLELLGRVADLPTFCTVQVWDFMSLYPSIMITFNICYANFRPDSPEYEQLHGLLSVDKDLVVTAAEAASAAGEDPSGESITCRDYLACFAPDSNCVLPVLEKSLFAQRKDYKKKMKQAYKDGHTALYNAYNAAQLAVKVVMNSAYGFTGVLGGKGLYPEPALAATITACGRDIIAMTKKMACERREFDVVYADKDAGGQSMEVPLHVLVTPDAEEFATLGPRPPPESGLDVVLLVTVVYGDTDSVMPKLICFNEDLSDAAWEAVGSYCADRITERFKSMFAEMGYPDSWIILEYEKLFRGYMLDKKKRYAGKKIEPGKPPVLSSSGLLTARRDNPPLARRLYGGILEDFIMHHDAAAAIQRLRDTLDALIENRVPLEDYVFTTQVRRTYANPDVLGSQLKVRGEEQGTPIEAGQRVAYYYGKPRKPDLGAGLKAELHFEDSPRPLQTSPCRYSLAKYLEKPIMGLLTHFAHLDEVCLSDVRKLFSRCKAQTKASGKGNRPLTAFFK